MKKIGFLRTIQNLVCILHFQDILIQTNHVSSEQSSHVAGGRHAGQHSFRD